MIVLILALIKNLFPPLLGKLTDHPLFLFPVWVIGDTAQWMATCVAFPYTNAVQVLWQRKLKDSPCSHSALRQERLLWNQWQWAAALILLVCSYRQGKGDPFPKGRADWQAPRHLHGAWSFPWRGGGWGWGLSVSFWRRRTFHFSEILKPRMLPAVVDITWSWRWSVFEVPDMHVGPLACCAWSSCFSLSDSSWLTSDKPTLNALSLQGGGDFSQLEFWTVH